MPFPATGDSRYQNSNCPKFPLRFPLTLTALRGSPTEADAESAALGIKAQHGSAGRILVSQSMKSHDIAGGGGVPTLELNFSFRFREPLELISYWVAFP